MKAKPCIALLSIGVTLAACQPSPSNTSPDNVSSQPDVIAPMVIPANENASIIVLDPATGQPSADPELLISGTASLLSPAQSKTPASELEIKTSENGTVTLVLDDTYHSSLIATLDCNGTVSTTHAGQPSRLDSGTSTDCSTDVKGDTK